MIKLAFLVIPFASRNVKFWDKAGVRGYTDYFVFGICVARFQRTTPW